MRLKSLAAPALLALVTVGFCWKLVFGGLVVIGYDTMTYMYPYRAFAAAALREGHIPLWNPHIYYGAPFLANLQSAVFYPLHVLFLALPAPTAMNWSVVLHLFLACAFAYLAARGMLGLDRLGAAVAGAVYGLGGFVGSQVGHLNQLNAAAWLPLALLALHHALRTRSRRWLAGLAAVLGVQLLAGHAQESYMTVVALAGYAVCHVLAAAATELREPAMPLTRRALAAGRRTLVESAAAALILGLAGALAAALAAAQLLPTNELTAHSIRAGGMSYGEAVSFSLPPRELFIGIFPTFGLAQPSSNEYLTWIGFGAMALALCGALFRVHRPAVLFFFTLCLVSFLLALGNHAPFYEWAFRLPGMRLFRVPARWMMLTSLGGAMLAGVGLTFLRQVGVRGWERSGADGAPAGPWQRLVASTRLLLAFGLMGGVAALLWPLQRPGPGQLPGLLIGIWLALGGAAIVLTFWAIAAAPSRWPSAVFSGFVLAELFFASRSLEYNNPNPPEVYTASRPVIDALHESSRESDRVLSIAATGYHPSDAEALVRGYEWILGPQGTLATLINTKYKEILNPNLPMVLGVRSVDGYDGGVLPLQRYVDYKRLVVAPEQNVPDALLRDQLRQVPSPARLRALGVTYLVTDAIADVTRDGVQYDLAGTTTLQPGQRIRFDHITPAWTDGGVTAVGVVTSLDGAAGLPEGAPVAAIQLGRGDMVLWQGTLVAGRDTAEGAYSPVVRHSQPAPLGPAAAGGSAAASYLAVLPVASLAGQPIDWVAVESTTAPGFGRVRLHAMSLLGDGGRSASVTVAGEGALRLIHRSDVKLYRNERALPRAYVVEHALVGDGLDGSLALLGRNGHDPQAAAVLERTPPAPPASDTLRGRVRRALTAVQRLLGVSYDHGHGTVPLAPPASQVPEVLAAAGMSASRQAVPGVPPSDGTPAFTARRAGDLAPRVEWEADTPERVTLRVTAPQGGLLVLRDTFFPGWEAYVDGRPAEVLRADVLFRAVPLPAGSREPHVVELRYRSRAFEAGVPISLASLAVIVGVAVVPLERVRRRRAVRRT